MVSIGLSQRAIAQRSTLCWSRSIATGRPSIRIEMRFLSEPRALLSCLGDLLAQDTLGAITADWPAARAGKQWVSGVAETFSQPSARIYYDIFMSPRATLLASFRQRTEPPAPKTTSSQRRPMSSEMRSPVWAATSSKVQSRRSAHVVRSGAENSASIWGRVRSEYHRPLRYTLVRA